MMTDAPPNWRRMGRPNLSLRQASRRRSPCASVRSAAGVGLEPYAWDWGLQRPGLLNVVENADTDLVRRIVLVNRRARLRIEQRIDRGAVQVAIADVERHAGGDLVANSGRERPGHRPCGRADRAVPVLLRESHVGLRRQRLPLRVDPYRWKRSDRGEVRGIGLAVGGLVVVH